jgi:hypothetical protein
MQFLRQTEKYVLLDHKIMDNILEDLKMDSLEDVR